MKLHELKIMDEKNLRNMLEELKKELMKLNAKVAVGTALENPMQIRIVKRMIARILTLLNKKEVKKKE